MVQISPSVMLAELSPSADLWRTDAESSGSVQEFSLPPGTTLLLADVDAGSNTPSMVGKVLKWRKEAGSEGVQMLLPRLRSALMTEENVLVLAPRRSTLVKHRESKSDFGCAGKAAGRGESSGFQRVFVGNISAGSCEIVRCTMFSLHHHPYAFLMRFSLRA